MMKTEDVVNPVVSEATGKAREMQNRMSETARHVSDTARQFGTSSDRYVRENPWMMVGIAALVGCVIGFLMRGQRD